MKSKFIYSLSIKKIIRYKKEEFTKNLKKAEGTFKIIEESYHKRNTITKKNAQHLHEFSSVDQSNEANLEQETHLKLRNEVEVKNNESMRRPNYQEPIPNSNTNRMRQNEEKSSSIGKKDKNKITMDDDESEDDLLSNPYKGNSAIRKGHKSQTTTNQSNVQVNIDPLTGQVKDVNVDVKMNYDDMKRLYQENKQYLPSNEQVVTGASATANAVKKSGVLENKNEKKDMFSALFGTKKKEF